MFAVFLFLNNIRTIANPIPTSAAAIVIIKIVKNNSFDLDKDGELQRQLEQRPAQGLQYEGSP